MSILFMKPSTVIKRLKTARTYAGFDDDTFKIWGAGNFEHAVQTSYFAKDSSGSRVPVLVVAVGNNTGSILHTQSSGEGDLVHNIDVHYIAPLKDRRAQYRDEDSIVMKKFLIKALHAFTPAVDEDTGEEKSPLLYTGDNLAQIPNVAGYARTYSFQQEMIVLDEETWNGDEDAIISADDLEDFTEVFSDTYAQSPPFDDVSDTSELDITLSDDDE